MSSTAHAAEAEAQTHGDEDKRKATLAINQI